MTDSIYEEPGDDYPSVDAEELLDVGDLPEMGEFVIDKTARTMMALDERIAVRTYAFATRKEKYELYRRFKGIRGSLNLQPKHKD